MRKIAFILAAFAAVSSINASDANAQIFRRSCVSGNCSFANRVAITNYQTSYAPYWYSQAATAPCESVKACDPVKACAPVEEFAEEVVKDEPCAPCAAVAKIPACAPVSESCDKSEEYIPTCAPCESVRKAETVAAICANGSCPLRAAAKNVAAKIDATAEFLAAANRIRAAHGLAALRADTGLDSWCKYQASVCSNSQQLIHGASCEILAYNSVGFSGALSQWLNSPAHRSLLLSPSFNMAGVAVVKDSAGRSWCAMRFR